MATESPSTAASADPRRARRADEHRRGPRAAARGLPVDLHPQDPVPGGEGDRHARSGPRPATASSPTPTSSGCATRCCSSATTTSRWPGSSRSSTPSTVASSRRRSSTSTRPCPRWRSRADGLPSPESFRRHDDLRLSRRELLKIAEIDEALLDQLEQYALVVPRRGTGHYDSDALVICTTARELADVRPRAAAPARVQDRRRPGGRAGRAGASPPSDRASDPAASARREDTISQLAALSVRMHATLVKTGAATALTPDAVRLRASARDRPADLRSRPGVG